MNLLLVGFKDDECFAGRIRPNGTYYRSCPSCRQIELHLQIEYTHHF